jgi:hypothetical protein
MKRVVKFDCPIPRSKMILNQPPPGDDDIYKKDYIVKIPYVYYVDPDNEERNTGLFYNKTLLVFAPLLSTILILVYCINNNFQVGFSTWLMIGLIGVISDILAYWIILAVTSQ